MLPAVRTDQRRRLVVWLVAAAVLGFFSTGRWVFPLAAWWGAVFGIRFFRNYPRAIPAYLLLAAASFVGGFSWWGATFIDDDPIAEVIFLAVQALLAPLTLVVDRWVVGRFRQDGRAPFWTSLAFPVAATATVFLFVGQSPAGTFGADAYSQYGWEPVMQLGAVTGLWGFTFLMAWFASVVNHAWESGFEWRTCGRGVIMYGTVLFLVVAFGAGRLWLSPDAEAEVRVIGVTSEIDLVDVIDELDEPTFETDVAALHDDYLDRTEAAATRGAEIVVWPEAAGLGRGDQVAALIDTASTVARKHGIYLVVPTLIIPEADEDPADNEVRVFTPTGEIGLTHVKYGGNVDRIYGEPGAKELQVLETPYGTLSAIICWDADYPNVVSQAGRNDVDLLFVSSNDWPEIKTIHARMAVFRAVENGVPLVRQDASGVSLVADAYGRELNYVDKADGLYEQDVLVPLNATDTLYPNVRDAFGWAAVLGFVSMIIGTWLKGRSQRRTRRELAAQEPVNA